MGLCVGHDSLFFRHAKAGELCERLAEMRRDLVDRLLFDAGFVHQADAALLEVVKAGPIPVPPSLFAAIALVAVLFLLVLFELGLPYLVAELGGEECFCVPYTHLTGFYGSVGFVAIPDENAPPLLRYRVAGYRTRGLDVLLMRRPGSVKAGD